MNHGGSDSLRTSDSPLGSVWAGAARSQWMGNEEAKVGDECRDEARGWW